MKKSCYTCKHRKLNDGKYYCNKSKELLIFNYEHEAELCGKYEINIKTISLED